MKFKVPKWAYGVLFAIAVFYAARRAMGMGGMAAPACPGSYVHCPGVGCVSGPDKCFPGNRGGPSAVFSKETFASYPGTGYTSRPPFYGIVEKFGTIISEANTNAMKKCPDGTRTDGPCLLEF